MYRLVARSTPSNGLESITDIWEFEIPDDWRERRKDEALGRWMNRMLRSIDRGVPFRVEIQKIRS